jgi:hypothetical protein
MPLWPIYFAWGNIAWEFCPYTDIILHHLAANDILYEFIYDFFD